METPIMESCAPQRPVRRYSPRVRSAVMFLLSWALSAPYAKAQEEDWRIESRPFASGAPTAWKAVPDQSVRDATDRPVLLRKGIGLSCLSRVFDVDLDSTPGLEIVTVPGNAAWRLTAVPVDSALPDDDTLLADFQAEGTCRRNVKERMGLSGRQRLLVRLTMWGWGGSDQQCLTLEKAGFVAERSETDADGMSGLMLTRHQAVLERAATIRPVKQAHPSLRYRDAEKQLLRQRAYSDYRPFAAAALATIDSIATEKALPDVRLDSELLSGSQWRQYPLRLAPPQAPALSPGKGWNLFDRVPGEDSWRPLYWHLTSQLVIGSALTDDPVFAEQAKRWALTVCRWKFWCQPGYAYFDFGTSYYYHRSVAELVVSRMPVSMSLGLWSFLIVYGVCIPLGIKKAVRDGSRFDIISSTVIFSILVPQIGQCGSPTRA